MAKPTLKPRWASTVTADPTRYVEPPPTKKDIGWDVGEDPPAQYANWLQGTTGQWIDWLDTFESTAHTWTATQTFTPSTAVPGVILGYNSATDTANETPSLAFKAGTSVQSVVDRLGLPSQRWLRREYAWWGAPELITVGAADTDVLITGELNLRQRHSGVGPVAGSPNFFQVIAELPETGIVPTFDGFRYLTHSSSFESVPSQYHTIYGDSIVMFSPATRALVLEFSVRIFISPAPANLICAIGLLKRGRDSAAGSTGRNIFFTASEAFSLATSHTYGDKWQVFSRTGGVTTITDTGVLATTWRRVRIEFVLAADLGGPRTNVYLDGTNVYTTTTTPATNYYAFSSMQQPLALGASSVSGFTDLSPVRILGLYEAI